MRILIITYYWPPSGGGGVQRWLKLSKYLAQHGIHPIIYTPLLKSYPHRDDSLFKDVASEVEVWKRPIWEPYSYFRKVLGQKKSEPFLQQGGLNHADRSLLQRLSLWIRAHFFVPDARAFWIRPSVRYLSQRLRKEPVDLVISTGPPHSMHLIGMGLQRRLSLRWWADFRDCWTTWDVLLSMKPHPIVMSLHRSLEEKVVRRCDKLISVSQKWCDDFRERGAKSTLLLYNGYDEADLVAISSQNKARLASVYPQKKKFQLLHLGSLSLSRSQSTWEALSLLCSEEARFAEALEITLGGLIDRSTKDYLDSDPYLSDRVRWLSYVPHREVFHYYQQASVLLLFSHISSSMLGQIPGKLFEYLAARKAILYIGSPQSEASDIIKQQSAGLCVNYQEPQQIGEAIRKLWQGASFEPKDPRIFSREQQARLLAQALFLEQSRLD